LYVGDEFQLGFGKIRRDVWVGQRRAEVQWMRLARECSVDGDPQAFLFDAALDTFEFRAVVAKRR
jgi:hypothetical protein